MENEENKNKLTCAFCGGPLRWCADFMSEEYGYEVEGKTVSEYECTVCGATATFTENLENETRTHEQ